MDPVLHPAPRPRFHSQSSPLVLGHGPSETSHVAPELVRACRPLHQHDQGTTGRVPCRRAVLGQPPAVLAGQDYTAVPARPGWAVAVLMARLTSLGPVMGNVTRIHPHMIFD
ncbi:hypothetical protein AAC387_Pa03g0441 [Persea americana]